MGAVKRFKTWIRPLALLLAIQDIKRMDGQLKEMMTSPPGMLVDTVLRLSFWLSGTMAWIWLAVAGED